MANCASVSSWRRICGSSLTQDFHSKSSRCETTKPDCRTEPRTTICWVPANRPYSHGWGCSWAPGSFFPESGEHQDVKIPAQLKPWLRWLRAKSENPDHDNIIAAIW